MLAFTHRSRLYRMLVRSLVQRSQQREGEDIGCQAMMGDGSSGQTRGFRANTKRTHITSEVAE